MTNGVINVKMSIIVDFHNINNEKTKQNKVKFSITKPTFLKKKDSIYTIRVQQKGNFKKMEKNKFAREQIMIDCYTPNEEKDFSISGEENSKYMLQSPANLIDVANKIRCMYEITVDEKKQTRYSCSTTKIGKLLTLATWIHAVSLWGATFNLFVENIISKRCGSTLEGLTLGIGNKDFTTGTDICAIIPDEFITLQPLEKNYLTDLVFFVFQNFGAYESYMLGNYINAYKPTNNENTIISIEDFCGSYVSKNQAYAKKLEEATDQSKLLKPLSFYIQKWTKEVMQYNGQN